MNVIEFTNFFHMALKTPMQIETSNPELAEQRLHVFRTECNTAMPQPTIALHVLTPGGQEQVFTLTVTEGEPIHN